ncbi:MAG: nucleotidyltransferase family protein, partial [Planctomycetota bacterium]
MKVVILAGGYGTRLKSVTKEIPKCFLEFGGKKVVERIIEKIEPVAAVDEVIISTNSRFRGQIESWMKHFRASKTISLVVERTDSERNKLGAIR